MAAAVNEHVRKMNVLWLKEFGRGSYSKEDLESIRNLDLQPTKGSDNTTILPTQQDKRSSQKKTIILDLDETLCHVDYEWVGLETDPKILRPYYKEFLDVCMDRFETVVWTRSSEFFAKKKCQGLGIDLEKVPLFSREYADSAGNKALYKLGRDPDQMLLIDDDPRHLHANPRSQLLVERWCGAKDDEELKHAIPILTAIADAETVQEVLDVHLARSYQANKSGDTTASKPIAAT